MLSFRIVLSEQNQEHDLLMSLPKVAYEFVYLNNEQNAKECDD